MMNYLLKCFHWKKYRIESYPTDLISLSQVGAQWPLSYEKFVPNYEILMGTDPLSDTHFKTLR